MTAMSVENNFFYIWRLSVLHAALCLATADNTVPCTGEMRFRTLRAVASLAFQTPQ
jgi:hypothetical protein